VTVVRALLSLLVFPGALFALPAGWFMMWLQRKINARAQGRIGPPFFQPFFDFVKLLAKEPVVRPRLQGFLMTALPLAAVASTLGAIALLPVFPKAGGFSGDLVLLVSLIEIGPLCAVLGGFVSRSLYGGIGASREAVLTLAYNLPFLTALVALVASAGSFSLAGVALAAAWPVRVLALIALVVCIPVKLHLNPFSAASAEQEIYAGSTTEYDGPRLALWELAHALEWVALTGLVASLAFPVADAAWPVRVVVFVAVSVALVVALSFAAASTARLKLAQTARWFLLWGSGLALSALVVAFVRL
jgi:NADH-quinone oxidoreductase subunit H